jgi:ubiquinone/menaquinone biosynthesis C-methylase UbiE
MRGLEQIPWFYDAFMNVADKFGGFGRWRRQLVDRTHGRTLEVGCGTGRNLPLYADDRQVIALDVHFEVMETARRRAPEVPLLVASAEALPFRPGSFDSVVSGLVFCSVPDPVRGLREVGRVLRQEGRLHMMEHVRARPRWHGRLQDWIQPLWTWVTGGCHPNRDTEANVGAAGFEIDRQGRRESGTMRLFTATRSRH